MSESRTARSSRSSKSSTGRKRTSQCLHKAVCCEPLEFRRMFSTISWTNRNISSGAGDNRFDEVFGTSANQAKAVIDAAILVWQRAIASFNYGTGTDVYNLTVTMNPANPPFGTSNTAGAANGGFDSMVNGKPKTGWMNLGWNSGSPPSGNSAAGWFLDPTPNESSEFQGTMHNAFAQDPTGPLGGTDLFGVVMHELGHAMGLGSTTQTQAVSFDTGVVDTAFTPASTPPSTLWAYVGNNSLWTSWDSGGASGAGASNKFGPQHFALPSTSAMVGGNLRVGAVALMNFTNRATLSDLEADCLRLAYGYSIQRPSRLGTNYATLDADGTLRVNTSSRANSNDLVVIDEQLGLTSVSITLGTPVATIDPVGAFSSEFASSQVQRIVVNTGTGTDTIRVESSVDPLTIDAGDGADIIDFGFTSRNLSEIAGSTTVNGGNGSDQLFTYDNAIAFPQTYTITSARFDRPGWGGFFYASDIEFLNLTTSSAADTVNVQSTFANGSVTQPVYLFSAGGADTVNIGNSVNGIRGINADVTVYNDPALTTLNINNGPDTGARTWNVDGVGNFGYLVGMAPARIYWDTADISSINLTCGSGLDTGQFVISTENFNVNNTGSDDSIRIGVPAAQGLQLISGQITIDNTPATTMLSIDDTGSSIARTLTLDEGGGYNTVVGFGPLIRFDNADTNTTIITGSASDTVNVLRNDETLVINSSGGSDVVNIGNTTNGVQLITGELTIRNTPSTSTVNINNGPDTIARTVGLQNVTAGSDILGRWTGLAPAMINYRYLDVSTVNVTFGSAADSILLRQSQKDLNLSTTGGIDAYAIGGSTDGAQSLLGNITLLNPPNHNNINVDNSGDTVGRTAILDDVIISGSPYGQLTGLAPATISWKHNDTTGVTLTGGGGADRFFVNEYKGAVALSILGGNGNDEVHFGNGNLAANIISTPSFNFDGQGGSADKFVINNTLAPASEQWNYGVDGPGLTASRIVGGVYNLNLPKTNVEQSVVDGNSGEENMVITAVSVGESFTFNGGAGGDTVYLPVNVSTAIRGPITIDGQAGPGNVITQTTNSSTAATTLHITDNTIGAFAGDNFFGVGGSLQFTNMNSILLTLGSGSDTVYARPNTAAALNIRGGNPTAAPGDRLNFATVGVMSPVFSGNPANGNLTSSNFARVDYSFFETGPTVDSTAPAGQTATANVNGAPPAGGGANRFAVDATFNDNVAGLLTGGSITVLNLQTELSVPTGIIAAEYIPASNTARFTFPGYANGALPDGNYLATVAGNLTDLFGNPLSAVPSVSFFSFAADATRDRAVNLDDFTILAASFGLTGRVFTQGNFNYDAGGAVNLDDFTILAAQFGKTLPALADMPRFSSQLVTARDEQSPVVRRSRLAEDLLSGTGDESAVSG